MMRRYLPGSGLLSRTKANLRPSGEKVMFVSMSVTSFWGVPPSTGARWRYFSDRTSNFTTHEVQVVAVGRKAQADIVHLRRRNDLGVAVGGDVADPEALQAVVIQHVEDVFGIGRNGDKRSLAGFRDLGDGDVLKGQGVAAGEEGVDTVGSGREQSKSNRAGDANAELVLASGCNYGRAGGRGNSAGWTAGGNCPHVGIGWAGGSALRHAA